jgi:hypothetical protein
MTIPKRVRPPETGDKPLSTGSTNPKQPPKEPPPAVDVKPKPSDNNGK